MVCTVDSIDGVSHGVFLHTITMEITGLSLFVVFTASTVSYLSRNRVPITVDNPQSSLLTVFSGTTFC